MAFTAIPAVRDSMDDEWNSVLGFPIQELASWIVPIGLIIYGVCMMYSAWRAGRRGGERYENLGQGLLRWSHLVNLVLLMYLRGYARIIFVIVRILSILFGDGY